MDSAVRQTPVVLVADDDEDILALVSLRLQRSGYEVVTARDGAEALRLAWERIPDAAVLDVSMPGMTGIDVTKHMRSNELTSRIPVVLLTARAGENDIAAGLAAGADEYITKPFSPQDLRACLEAVLATA
jgi:DNA-binding response OmpR family regulator